MRRLFLTLFLFLSMISESYSKNSSNDPALNEAMRAYESGNIEKSFELYMKAAEQGNPIAQQNIGEMYFWGQSVEVDIDKAFEWYMKAAEQGDDSAQYKIARIYFADQDFANAFEWYMKAAEQGHSDSQGMVGMFYASGLLEDRNFSKAEYWLNKAAKQGNQAAVEALQILNSVPERETEVIIE